MIELNKVFLVCRLTRDPELRYIPSGTAVCEMRVASDRRVPGKPGSNEPQKESLFVNVVAWGKTAEFCNEYMRKGSAMFVEGRLKFDSWEDKNGGGKRERISIVADRVQFAETKAEAQARTGRGGDSGGPDYGDLDLGPRAGSGAPPSQTTDDLPF